MTGRVTTQKDVDMVLEMRSRGYAHGQIVSKTKLPGNTVTRIFDGWRPSGKKPVRLLKKQDSAFISAPKVKR